MNVTSWILPWSTSDRNSEKPISFSFWALLPVFTTCQSRMAETAMTAQNNTVLIVEFTQNSSKCSPNHAKARRRPVQPILDAGGGNSTGKSLPPHSRPFVKKTGDKKEVTEVTGQSGFWGPEET